MKIGSWARFLLTAAPLLAGCGNFWQAPSGSSGTGSFSLSSDPATITIAPAATSGNTSTITVTPSSSSFTGTVTLACALTTSPSSATSPASCTLSSTSFDFSSSDSAQTATLTATTTATTTTGGYLFTVTGSSSGVSSETTSVCVEVTSGSCSSATGTSGYFFVLNQTTNEIVSMQVSSGKVVGNSYTLPAKPFAVAVAPNGKFLYVSTELGIYLYTIGSNGSLTLEYSGLPIAPAPYTPNAMQVDSTNYWLVFAISGSNQLYALAINSSNGDLAVPDESPVTFAAGLPSIYPTQLAISPGDSSSCGNCYVFVAMGSGGTELIHFNPGNSNPFGTYGHIGLINNAGGDNTVAVDPSNRLLYIGESTAVSGTQTGGLRAFTLTSTGYNEISGSPYPSQGTGPVSILPSADGSYVYVANQSVSGSATDNIASYSVSTGSLTYIATATAGPSGKIGLAEDSSGGYLLAVDFEGDPDLQGFTMSSGTLTSVFSGATTNNQTTAAGPIAIAALP